MTDEVKAARDALADGRRVTLKKHNVPQILATPKVPRDMRIAEATQTGKYTMVVYAANGPPPLECEVDREDALALIADGAEDLG